MSISTVIPAFTATPLRTNPSTFSEDTDTYHTELAGFISACENWRVEANSTASIISTQHSETEAYKNTTAGYVANALSYSNQAQSYSNEALSYKTGAELAYINTQALVNNLVIPTSATYTYAEIDDSFTNELDTFLNFKI